MFPVYYQIKVTQENGHIYLADRVIFNVYVGPSDRGSFISHTADIYCIKDNLDVGQPWSLVVNTSMAGSWCYWSLGVFRGIGVSFFSIRMYAEFVLIRL